MRGQGWRRFGLSGRKEGVEVPEAVSRWRSGQSACATPPPPVTQGHSQRSFQPPSPLRNPGDALRTPQKHSPFIPILFSHCPILLQNPTPFFILFPSFIPLLTPITFLIIFIPFSYCPIPQSKVQQLLPSFFLIPASSTNDLRLPKSTDCHSCPPFPLLHPTTKFYTSCPSSSFPNPQQTLYTSPPFSTP